MSEQASPEIFKGFRVFSLPPSARWALLGILITLGTINTALFSIGLVEDAKHEWVKASLELMSVILPFLLLAIVIFFSSSIANQTRRKTIEFLLVEAPKAFAALRESEESFEPASKRISRRQFVLQKSTIVNVRHTPGSCCADYRLQIPANPARNSDQPQSLVLRLELNVHRLTFCLAIESNRLPAMPEQTEKSYLDWFSSTFQSTLSGARHVFDEPSHVPSNSHSGYHFNRTGSGSIDGKVFRWFVASRDLKPDYLWDGSERIYIVQDMMFMLRAFLSECPEVFVIEPTKKSD